MKKTAALMFVLMITIVASAAVAGDRGQGMVGRLFLFQKCLALDPEQPLPEGYKDDGCPATEGAWPIIPDNRRWGQMKYNLLGPEFRFSFQGKNLDAKTGYTLLYYADPWPGSNSICLGDGVSNAGGNLQIHGSKAISYEDTASGLPTPGDSNYFPKEDGSVTGAKIWLVLSADVVCAEDGSGGEMQNWNPSSYLFEGNPIIYQYDDGLSGDTEDGDGDLEQPGDDEESTGAPDGDRGNNGKALGKGKKK